MRAEEKKTIQWIGFNGLLWILVIISALAVIRSTHESRRLVNVVEEKRRQSTELHVQWGQYLLEQSAWSSYGRIEKRAKDELQMMVPVGEQLVVVKP